MSREDNPDGGIFANGSHAEAAAQANWFVTSVATVRPPTHIQGMSNPNPAHKPAGTPDGGQFAKTSQSEAIDVQLDGAHGTEAVSTDPRELIAHLAAEREADLAEIEELREAAQSLTNYEYHFNRYEEAKDGFAEREFQRFNALADSVRTAPAQAPVVVTHLIGTAEAVRDRRALDSIACMLGESQEWDSGYIEGVADMVARSGRPHPGKPALSDSELAAVEGADEDPEEACAEAYRAKLNTSHTEAAAAKLDHSELGTEGLDAEITAAWQQSWDAKERAQTLTTRSMARNLLTAVPDAAYLDVEQDEENRGHMRPLSIRNAAGEEIVEDVVDWENEEAGRPDLSYFTSQLDDDSGSWNQFCVDVPGEGPFHDPTFRIDLRAATKAGE